MTVNELTAVGHWLAMAVFAVLTVLMLSRWKDRPKSAVIALASAATVIWAGTQAIGSLGYIDAPVMLLVVEWIRNIAWLTVLGSMLRNLDVEGVTGLLARRFRVLFVGVCALLTVYYVFRTTDMSVTIGVVVGGVAMSALALIMTEQLYRNAPFDAGSGLKYFCVGMAGIYAYDLVIFMMTVVSGAMNADQWAVRGFVTGIFAFPILFAARRSLRLSLDRYIPRQFVFYSFAAITIGTLIVLTLIGDFYLQAVGDTWSGVLRIGLLALGVFVVAVLLVSRTVRARVRVFLMKTFFEYKYDYRKEWLRFIGTLSGSELDNVSATAVRAVAQIVNSSGGIVWVQEEEGKDYLPLGSWQCDIPDAASVAKDSSLVHFLRRRQWVVDLNEMHLHPGRYEDLVLESWIQLQDKWWLIVPLFLQNRLFGFIVLEKPRIVPSLNFEDHDLLRTVGRHVATHIDQAEADRRLAESSQFGTYNRLTAFLMHDLNNLIAQQSLVVKNAERHRHNPQFVDDAIGTIANSVERMRRLMAQLSSVRERSELRAVDLRSTVDRATKRCEPRLPHPAIVGNREALTINADPERLTTVFEHLIRNAQDATQAQGHVSIQVSAQNGHATVSIEDDGCGMSAEFIRERLFRPFDSTKGSQSMGIGVYQAREYVRELGGQLEVSSVPGDGTRFDVRLPLA
jgi:putative PEP-CTERM system histidine kinase